MLFDSRKLKESLFGKNKTDEMIGLEADSAPHMRYYLLSVSDTAYICSMAAKTCYGRDVDPYYEQNLKHVGKIMSYGHDSISGHSNISFVLTIVSSFNSVYPEIIKSLPALRFMNIALLPQKESIDEESLYTEFEDVEDVKNISIHTDKLLISGSVRAYRYYLYKMIKTGHTEDNLLYPMFRDVIYSSIEKEFFPDFIKKGYLEEDRFLYHPSVTNIVEDQIQTEHFPKIEKPNVDCWYCDKLDRIESELKLELGYYSKEENEVVEDPTPIQLIDAILDTTVITVKLHDYSRAISQQINRHLSAISQESQRYVNYSSAKFIDPTPFNPDKYDTDKKYTISIGSTQLELTSKELGTMLISLYPQLEFQGMINQDARSFLPMNVETKAVHTFTLTNMLHFIKLRTDRAAQPEVQNIANQLKEIIETITENCSEEFKNEVNRRMNPITKDFM